MTNNQRALPEFHPSCIVHLRMTWLAELLSTMDIPDMRRDITKIDNVRWLLRNIAVRNGKNEQVSEAIAVLHVQRKHLQKGA